MKPAPGPRDRRNDARLMVLTTDDGTVMDTGVDAIATVLRRGDLLVLNDAATFPASLTGRTTNGRPIEIRLLHGRADGEWLAVAFGDGDWRTPTERRPPPPRLQVGDGMSFSGGLGARLVGIDPRSDRLWRVSFDRRGAALWEAIYRAGVPIQYSYQTDPLELWSMQTVYASRPWAAELPSAGRPLTWALLIALRRRGVEIATLTHAAGLSATGDDQLDALLPLRERYDIPSETVDAIARARRRRGRVIAVGTTVVRALEASARQSETGLPTAGPGSTELVLGPKQHLRIVDGLLTGMHEAGESHFALMQAFAPSSLLHRAQEHAAHSGYLSHELGDLTLLLPTRAAGSAARSRRSRPRAKSTAGTPAAAAQHCA